uniref:Uncharacterized protein n=1 Tax=Plectus sambesii TaxID=2011161 RepID=A0A914V8C4_9BILA
MKNWARSDSGPWGGRGRGEFRPPARATRSARRRCAESISRRRRRRRPARIDGGGAGWPVLGGRQKKLSEPEHVYGGGMSWANGTSATCSRNSRQGRRPPLLPLVNECSQPRGTKRDAKEQPPAVPAPPPKAAAVGDQREKMRTTADSKRDRHARRRQRAAGQCWVIGAGGVAWAAASGKATTTYRLPAAAYRPRRASSARSASSSAPARAPAR